MRSSRRPPSRASEIGRPRSLRRRHRRALDSPPGEGRPGPPYRRCTAPMLLFPALRRGRLRGSQGEQCCCCRRGARPGAARTCPRAPGTPARRRGTPRSRSPRPPRPARGTRGPRGLRPAAGAARARRARAAPATAAGRPGAARRARRPRCPAARRAPGRSTARPRAGTGRLRRIFFFFSTRRGPAVARRASAARSGPAAASAAASAAAVVCASQRVAG